MSTVRNVSHSTSWCALKNILSINAKIKQIELVSRCLIELVWKYEEVVHSQHQSSLIKYTPKCSFRWSLWQEPSESRSIRVLIYWFFLRFVEIVTFVITLMIVKIYSKVVISSFLCSYTEIMVNLLHVTVMHFSCHSHFMSFCLEDLHVTWMLSNDVKMNKCQKCRTKVN